MTALRREVRKIAEEILVPALSDNPQTQEAIDYAKDLAEKIADAILSLRAFKTDEETPSYDVKKGSDEWKEKLGNEVAEKSIEAAIIGGKKVRFNPQKEIFELEVMINEQLARLGMNWNEEKSTEQGSFRKFLKKEKKENKELRKFVDWWMSDEWRVANPPWNLGTIRKQWNKAFLELKPAVEIQVDNNDIPKSY